MGQARASSAKGRRRTHINDHAGFLLPAISNGSGKPSVSMASRGLCCPRLVRNHAGYFASCAARYASASFFSSSAVSFGGSTEIVTLLILPVNVNGI